MRCLIKMAVEVIRINFEEEIRNATPVPELVQMKKEMREDYARNFDKYRKEELEEQGEVARIMNYIVGCEPLK